MLHSSPPEHHYQRHISVQALQMITILPIWVITVPVFVPTLANTAPDNPHHRQRPAPPPTVCQQERRPRRKFTLAPPLQLPAPCPAMACPTWSFPLLAALRRDQQQHTLTAQLESPRQALQRRLVTLAASKVAHPPPGSHQRPHNPLTSPPADP